MNKILLLGPRYSGNGNYGGVVVLFELLLDELNVRGIEYECIDTNKNNYRNRIFAYFFIVIKFLLKARKCAHVSLHGTAGDYKYLAPVVVFLCKRIRRPVSLRKFAGSFIDVYEGSGFLVSSLVRYALKHADFCFFETHYLVKYFRLLNPNTFWFPNVRKRSEFKTTAEFSKRFVFLGQVKEEKGVDLILSAINDLPEGYTVDIYGDLYGQMEERICRSRANYKGVVRPDDVVRILSDYDVLLLPTYWAGEGYPGVIIEAFSVGLPVISTGLRGISEIVQSGKNGILIEVRRVDQLVMAMQLICEENYLLFSNSAKDSFSNFDSEVVTNYFINSIGLYR